VKQALLVSPSPDLGSFPREEHLQAGQGPSTVAFWPGDQDGFAACSPQSGCAFSIVGFDIREQVSSRLLAVCPSPLVDEFNFERVEKLSMGALMLLYWSRAFCAD